VNKRYQKSISIRCVFAAFSHRINLLFNLLNFGNSVIASNVRFYLAHNFLMSLTEISITEHNLRSSVSFHDGNPANFHTSAFPLVDRAWI